MKKKITIIEGDGIGPEIACEAKKVLNKISKLYGHQFEYEYKLAGGIAIDTVGECLPQETIDSCLSTDSTLLAAVGGYKWDNLAGDKRPEKALLGIRKIMGLYSNIRPSKLYKSLAASSPLRADITAKGIDFVIVRELTGGVYFGEHSTVTVDGELVATDIMIYSESEIERITKVAIAIANKRNNKITIVDKANILDTSRLWRVVCEKVLSTHPEITVDYMYVDNCSMQLLVRPFSFDVILTENMFGDILSDEASMITGTIGTIGSASLGEGSRGMYEPIHGSAPDIAGQNIANPIGMICSVSMMLRYSFGMNIEADNIDRAVEMVLERGYRTNDMMSNGAKHVSCSQMGELIVAALVKIV